MRSPEPTPSQESDLAVESAEERSHGDIEQDALQDREIEQRVVQKINRYLIPFLALLYTFCILDRGNISIAALQMKPSLLSDSDYGLGTGIFFLSYFLCEVPSNLIMERVGARWWIARIMITWGLISAAMMFATTPSIFYVLRFLLGAAEAGFYPGVLLYLTYWVPASSRAKVIARFLAISAVLGLFGNPIGGQLLRLGGIGGLAGWQWLFLIEGIPSVLIGFLVFRYLPNTPEETTWLTPEEKNWISNRLKRESESKERVAHFSWREALLDRRIVTLCLIFILIQTANNAISAFAPQIIKSASGTGASQWSDPLVATVMAIPALLGAIAMVVAARHSDRTGKRRLHIVGGYIIAGIGFLLCLVMPQAAGIVFAIALSTFGERIAAGSYWAVTTSVMGARAAAGGIAFINSVGNLGGFIGPILMGQLKTQNNGSYVPGIYIAGFLMLAGALVALATLGKPQKS